MAEFALGLTKTALEGTVSRVQSAVDAEEKLKVQVQNDLMFITGEFQMMQSFLNVANKERAKNEVVRTWVRQIRDLAFDVEDCVELVISLDMKSGLSWLWRVLPSCMAPPRPMDDAVGEIQRLKARVEDVSHRNIRYNLINDSGSGSTSNPKTNALAAATSTTVFSPANAGASAAASFHILTEVWEAAGKKRPDMADLKKLINSEGNHLEVISLWPSQGSFADLGLGFPAVTDVIREAYNDPKICQEFKSRAWVKLINPFNPHEFLKSMVTQFYANSHLQQDIVGLQFQKKMKAATQEMEDEFMQQWSQQRYLVIVEQISTVAEWDAIRIYLPDNGKGSRIVVASQHLGLALCCTGKPYQVSDLGQFSDGQSLCVFFNKVSGRRSDMGELIWQLRCGGVISLWEDDFGKSTLASKLFNCITHKSKECGVQFDRHSWIDVPASFDVGVFSRHLFLDFHSNDLQAWEIAEVSMMGDEAIIQRCCKILQHDNCLVVINGLEFSDEWDLIRATFLSNRTKGCILVLGKNARVATYCVERQDRAFKTEDLEVDSVLRHTIKACEYIGIGGKEASSRGHFFSNRRKEAHDWMDKFKHGVPDDEVYDELKRCILRFNPGVICLCGTASAGKSALARRIYYNQMLIVREDMREETFDIGFTKYSWVDVPHPFDLRDFSWRLLLDFHSDDLHSKDTVLVSLMYGHQDPIEGCLQFLRQHKCFIVIDGLRSTDDWDLIQKSLVSKPTEGCILVITNEASVATHCVHEQNRVINVKNPNADVAHHPLIKNKWSLHERSRVFSSRMVKAREWINNFELIGHDYEWFHLCSNLLNTSSHSVISVWGIAGVGKSALVRSFYYKNMIGLSQYINSPDSGLLDNVTKYSWVDVSHPFNLRDLSRRLLLDFHSDDLEAKETEAGFMMDGQDPIQRCRNIMCQDKCFVVIDGLRSMNDWDFIKIAFLSKPIKGCILVITNDKIVAAHCVEEEDQMINIKGLDADAALHLFTQITWKGKQQLTSSDVELSIPILAKCGGLPKVINAIGQSLCASDGWDKQLFESINANFMAILENDPRFRSLRGLFSWMQSYFDDCFLQDSLKPCIFYLSVFPFGHNIRIKRLLRRWIAEGYSRDTPGSSMEEYGEMIFSKIEKLSIIQQQKEEGSPSRADVCQVNGFFREYIFSRPMQDNLVFALDGRCIINSQRVGQHLTISSSWDRDKIVFESMELSRLRSLTVFGEWRSFFISTNVNMRLLRVLDLEDTSGLTDGDLEHFGKLVPRLKFLSLRGCKEITRLPKSLCGMRQMQTLDIKGTSIVTLPKAILKLQKLQYVRAGTIRSFTSQPPPLADGDGAGPSQPAAERASLAPPPTPADGDGMSTRDTPPAAAFVAADGDGVSTSQPPPTLAAADDEARTSTPCCCRPHGGLVLTWMPKLCRPGLFSKTRDGVQFSFAAAGGIGKLTVLHTLGVVNVSGASGKAALRELRKLTQLRKLKLSGINQKNWKDFCYAISGHGYLESLSVRLDQEDSTSAAPAFGCFSDISEAPKSLKTLKVYGKKAHISPLWMKQLHSLIKADLELTVSAQKDIDALADLTEGITYPRLSVKPIQDGELKFEWGGNRSVLIRMKVLEIYCSSYRSQIMFRPSVGQRLYIDVLVVHCTSSTGASLELSGLDTISLLKKVMLKGSYNDAVKQDLQQQVGRLRRVKFETDPSSS